MSGSDLSPSSTRIASKVLPFTEWIVRNKKGVRYFLGISLRKLCYKNICRFLYLEHNRRSDAAILALACWSINWEGYRQHQAQINNENTVDLCCASPQIQSPFLWIHFCNKISMFLYKASYTLFQKLIPFFIFSIFHQKLPRTYPLHGNGERPRVVVQNFLCRSAS